MDGTGPQLRTVRAALFTALCVTLSSASHVLLSHTPLPLTSVVLLSVAVFTIAYALAGRERGFWSIAALLVPLELAADTVFTTGQDTCYGPSGGPVAGSLRSMGVTVLCGGGDVGTPLAGVTHPGGGTPLAAAVGSATPWLLLTAHIAVGLIASAWLRRGEAAVGRLLLSVAGFAFRPLLLAAAAVTSAPRPLRPAPRVVRPARPAPALPLLVHSVVRRGPPRSALV
ncbi:hypothetical protein HUT19_30290 [Streptomyces sp. NA02950]|uniref:hypothetical protein n=1 Tax=Streptomyces sp. NA02950 TaxID=2742137 RepID=UPI001592AD28|nr:hypothetical protein [Streptomyces sp. NA02950]QKV95497.1 hypothetical protein HUT19_30290 [Streptomyces sp. NA02950]